MTNQDDASPKYAQQQKQQQSPPVVPTAPPAAAADVESQSEAATGHARAAGSGFGVAGIIRRWKRNDLVKKGGVALRGLSLVLSLLAAIIMASNKHGDWKDFDKYEEYRYLLAIAILATLYSGAQAFKVATGKEMFQRRTSALADFIGDQIMAYLLISSASSAIPLTNRMRESQDNIFTDASASAISMAFLAFVTHALLALISGHKLSSQSYI
ncbi:PREDICTED: CASP-like protein 4B1 [Fragaria vesca subsp. vesca]|uniref:CASP-like protein 4B1 n=1 Tax=Fragaria vesca subsp. vesca TaxID=101020 RepID=UPI0002C36B92|nr:PREDICTED: CASP-like protein 4B1 [Fragaria vesca subsp. vesca]